MDRIKVIYWSSTGNTKAMAEAVARGVESAGVMASVIDVDTIKVSDVEKEQVLALGCPAMGDEVLEEGSMEPFMEELETSLEGKKIALFGAYGWGDGQWMRDWEGRVKSKGAELIDGKGLLSCEEPDDQILADCEKLGKKLAGSLS